MNFYPKEKTFLVTSYHFTDIRQCQEQRNISEVERVSFPYFYQYWILLRNFSNKGVREITVSEMVFLKYLHHPASLKNNSTSTILELSIIFIIFFFRPITHAEIVYNFKTQKFRIMLNLNCGCKGASKVWLREIPLGLKIKF